MKPLTPRKDHKDAVAPPARTGKGTLQSHREHPRGEEAHARPLSSAAQAVNGRDPKGKSAESASTSAPSASCPQCHCLQSSFYCGTCLSERIIFHHANTRRVREARQKAKEDVEERLGTVPDTSAGEEDGHVPGAIPPKKNHQQPELRVDAKGHTRLRDLDARRKLLAKKASLEDLIQATKSRTARLQDAVRSGQLATASSRLSNERRSLALQSAKSIYLGERHESTASAAAQLSTISTASAAKLRLEIAELQKACDETCALLTHARASRAREAAELFSIQAPVGTLANQRMSREGLLSGVGYMQPTSARTQRSKERYMPGGFSFDFSGAFDLGGHSKYPHKDSSHRDEAAKGEGLDEGKGVATVNLNDWTINGLVVPLTRDVHRFPRNAINGALEHLVHLLHLLASYLGITLPFVIGVAGGVLTIRPNVLWGSGSKETLHISSTAYQALAANASESQRSGNLGDLGASMMSTLGASTLSTFESFVRLPSATQLPWAKSQVENKGGGPRTDATIPQDANAKQKKQNEVSPSASVQFGSAFSMLVYDVAYLASTQGVPIDILAAAGNPLRVLFKAVNGSGLGQRSHMTHYPPMNIANLVFSQLDFTQLSQIHESGGGAHRLILDKQSHASKSVPRQRKISLGKDVMGSKPQQVSTELDGSYIDAEQAAASILDVRVPPTKAAQTSTRTKAHESGGNKAEGSRLRQTTPLSTLREEAPGESSRPRNSGPITHRGKTMQSSLATERMPGALPAPQSATLEFLRARGQRGPQVTHPVDSEQAPLQSTTAKGNPTKAEAKVDSQSRKHSSAGRYVAGEENSLRKSKKAQNPSDEAKSNAEPDKDLDKKSAKPKNPPNDSPRATAGGTITFNGKPVQGTLLRDKTGRSAKRASGSDSRPPRQAKDDDDWDVL